MAVDPVLYRTPLQDENTKGISREWIRYFNQLGNVSSTAANSFTGINTFANQVILTVPSSLGPIATGKAPLQVQVLDSQSAIDLWSKAVLTTPTPAGGSRWRIFADNVGGGGGNLTFGFFDTANNRMGAGFDNAGVLTASQGLNVPNPINITLGSGWLGFTPSLSASGSMTVSGVSVGTSQYIRIGPFVHIQYDISFTLGGVASNQVNATLPVRPVGNAQISCHIVNMPGYTGLTPAWCWFDAGANLLHLLLNGEGNYSLGGVRIVMNATYRCV